MVAKPLVVIVEDDRASAEALSLVLRDWGAEVIQGDCHDQIVATLGPRVAEVGWIITDFHLGPGPDGVTLVKDLSLAAPQARILILSGSFHGKATTAAAKAGYEIMQKPASARAIVAWLERR